MSVLKTTGKKKRRAVITIVLLIIAAAVVVSRPGILHRIKDAAQRKGAVPERSKAPAAQEQKPVRPEARQGKPDEKPMAKLAIIIDDVGYPTPLIDVYGKFQGKLTFSILPFQPESANYARMLHSAGYEIIIHIPMEPENFPVKKPGRGALFVDDSRNEVEHKLKSMMHNIPQASGANNHMGSKATQDHTLMTHTLSYLKAEGFYFIDSLTTPHSTVKEVAREIRMKSVNRDIFLDNHNDSVYIENQFEKLKSVAQENGTAIGIGHVQNKELLSVLNRQAKSLHEEGFELVFVSELIRN
jgi:polysaccharide deacetylase 2 family uncharacterized protein YibQ